MRSIIQSIIRNSWILLFIFYPLSSVAQDWNFHFPAITAHNFNDVHISDDFAWDILNPFPQSNNLHTITQTPGGSIVAAGALGTIIKSDDNGLTWKVTYFAADVSVILHDISFSGDVGWAVGQSGTILKSTDGGSSWSLVVSGTTVTLQTVEATSGQTVFAGGAGGTLLYSDDGGDSWEAIDLEISNDVNSVAFADANHGWLALSFQATIDDISSSVMHTTDGGETWSLVEHPAPGGVNVIAFYDTNNGYMGAGGRLFSTSDGGTTWSEQESTFQNAIQNVQDIYVQNATTAWAVDLSGNVLQTTDGINWSGAYRNLSYAFRGVTFSGSSGFVVGNNGQILSSNDSGENWSFLGSNIENRDVRDLHFVSNDLGFMVNSSRFIYRTENGGDTWTRYDTELSVGIGGGFGFVSMHFSDPENGWAVNQVGDVARTTDAGLTWEVNSEVLTVSTNRLINSVFAVDEDIVYIGGGFAQTFFMMKTEDGGETWSSLSAPDVIRGLYFTDASTGYATTQYMVFKTENGGSSWSAVTDFALGNSFTEVQFVTENTGFVLNNENLLITQDAGITWSRLGETENVSGNSFYFLNEDEGWLAGNRIWRTEDGGQTWEEDQKQATSEISSVFAFSDRNIWLGGSNGLIMRSANADVISIEPPASSLPKQFELGQNYPNPFNPTTSIPFELPVQQHVRISVYDVLGRQVAVLLDEQRTAGTHTITFDATPFSSGVYVYRLETGGQFITRKMTLIK